MRHVLTRCLSLMALLAVAACGDLQPLIEAIEPPTIAADPIPVDLADNGRTLTATVTAPGPALEITSVAVRVARDTDAARFSLPRAVEFPAAAVPANGGPVSVTLPPGYRLSRAQLLTAQWIVSYRLASDGNNVDVTSNIVSNRLGCTAGDVTAMLRAINIIAQTSPAIPQIIATPLQVQALLGRGYLPSHQFVSFAGMGVAFAHVSALLPPNLIDLMDTLTPGDVPFRPTLLFYAPRPGANQAQVTEPVLPDTPYRLIGVAFARPYDPDNPPDFGCIPREAFFVHNAGWHMLDGGFINQAVAEPVPGAVVPVRPRLGLVDPRRTGIWHGRLWDIHIWLRPLGETPRVSACDLTPGNAPPASFFTPASVATCGPGAPRAPALGAQFPAGGFFTRLLPP